MRRDAQITDAARAEREAEAEAPKGATVKGGVISGKVPYRPQDAPAWLDALFPEGPIESMLPPAPLEALI